MKTVPALYTLLRISLGWIFLWAFIDKLFGLGFTTAADKAWLMGTSPTAGFLKAAASGPFAPFYQSIAGHPITDTLFMIGLLLIGVSLLVGVMMRLAGYGGALLMLLMYTVVLPPEHNPLVDEHVIYGLLLLLLAQEPPAHQWSLARWWSAQPFVKKYPWLI